MPLQKIEAEDVLVTAPTFAFIDEQVYASNARP